MTDAATLAHARKNGTTIEWKKYAYRQSKEGMVISFVVHPNDMKDKIAGAPIGTRYIAVLFEADDNVSFNAGAEPASSTPAVSDSPTAQTQERVRSQTTPTIQVHVDKEPHQAAHAPPSGGDRKRWDELPYSQQAAIRCQEPEFIQFISEYGGFKHVDTAEDAAWVVRELCRVSSRRDIVPQTEAGRQWERIDSDYILHKQGARV